MNDPRNSLTGYSCTPSTFADWLQYILVTVSLLLTTYLVLSIGNAFFPQYLHPGFLVEFRSFATIETALALREGVNPFAIDNPGGRSNLYTVTWPFLC